MKSPYSPASLVLVAFLGVATACAVGTSAPVEEDILPSETGKPADPSTPIPTKTPSTDDTSSGGPPADPPNLDEPNGPDADAGAAPVDAGSTIVDAGPDAIDAGPVVVDAGSGAVDAGAPILDGGSCVTGAPSHACGLAPQCGCAGNETCVVEDTTTGAVGCALAGGGPLASLCTTSSQCAVGLTCAYGACRPYCETVNIPCSGTGLGSCTELATAAGTPVPNAAVCTITCDLRNPSPVCGSNTCIWDRSVHSTDCDKAGTKSLYAACSSYNDCAPGLACVNHPWAGFECERWCRVGNDFDCGFFESCVDVYGADAPTQGGEKLGHCQ